MSRPRWSVTKRREWGVKHLCSTPFSLLLKHVFTYTPSPLPSYRGKHVSMRVDSVGSKYLCIYMNVYVNAQTFLLPRGVFFLWRNCDTEHVFFLFTSCSNFELGWRGLMSWMCVCGWYCASLWHSIVYFKASFLCRWFTIGLFVSVHIVMGDVTCITVSLWHLFSDGRWHTSTWGYVTQRVQWNGQSPWPGQPSLLVGLPGVLGRGDLGTPAKRWGRRDENGEGFPIEIVLWVSPRFLLYHRGLLLKKGGFMVFLD